MARWFSLDRQDTIAAPGFNRWLVPPAALAIHLCIGMAYGFSVFWLPLSRAIGITSVHACPVGSSLLEQIFARDCDWKIALLGWTYTLFFVFLGSSAALWGGWLERAGPRKAGVVSALCWCGGLLVSALGVYLHEIVLMWLGSGVIGGIGLGLGYISPVSTLIKWFPDRRGMATGMAIMGFGGGAMIGAPLADRLMRFYATPVSVGVWETFLTLAAIYFVFMMCGALAYRVPPSDWHPEGKAGQAPAAVKQLGDQHVHVEQSWRTPQFWLVWAVLCMNVSAGIGVLGMASPLLQEVFGGRLIGVQAGLRELNTAQQGQVAAIAAGFTGLLSLFNIGGRFFWATLSDRIGRKTTYSIFFLLGITLYLAVPSLARSGSLALFVAAFCVILSMYGGGFSTVPAYLADLFGTQMVGAIHGRLLTAWSVAGIFGPQLVNYIREYQLGRGLAPAQVYDATMYAMVGFLLIGLVCNLAVAPVARRYFMDAQRLAALRGSGEAKPAPASPAFVSRPAGHAVARGTTIPVVLAWSAMGIPVLAGIWITLQKAAILFH